MFRGDSLATQETIILYILLGGMIGIIYSLRRMYALEKQLAGIKSMLGKRKR